MLLLAVRTAALALTLPVVVMLVPLLFTRDGALSERGLKLLRLLRAIAQRR